MGELELNNITVRSLMNKLKGFRKSHQDDWERTRMLAYYMVLPHVTEEEKDNFSPLTLMPFPWDDETKEMVTETVREKAKRMKEDRDRLWAKVDGRE